MTEIFLDFEAAASQLQKVDDWPSKFDYLAGWDVSGPYGSSAADRAVGDFLSEVTDLTAKLRDAREKIAQSMRVTVDSMEEAEIENRRELADIAAQLPTPLIQPPSTPPWAIPNLQNSMNANDSSAFLDPIQ